ncbi:hypothetical protein [Culturomica massiliensis]|uniref:hypothetical protein n=1 Tax=Culturomica massiliensis TaxID=1841857 RepID=UPI0011C397B1|nr:MULTISPECIES: hypothetical protein [Odoribacteraceae]
MVLLAILTVGLQEAGKNLTSENGRESYIATYLFIGVVPRSVWLGLTYNHVQSHHILTAYLPVQYSA